MHAAGRGARRRPESGADITGGANHFDQKTGDPDAKAGSQTPDAHARRRRLDYARHQDTVGAVLIIPADDPHLVKTVLFVERAGGGVRHFHHEDEARDIAAAETA